METKIVARALLALALPACATSESGSYGAMRAEVAHDEARVAASRVADERALTGDHLDRTALVRAVLDRNPTIESARHAWRAALARHAQVQTLDDPMVSFGVAPLSVRSGTPFGYEVGVSQRLPFPGKLGLQGDVVTAEAEAMRGDYEATRLQLALTASHLFDDYYVADRSLDINADHVALMTDMKRAATVQFQSGRASAQDPLQAEFELAHMEHDRIALQSERAIVVAQLNELLHRDAELPLPPPPMELEAPPAPAASAPRIPDAIAHRPDVAAARAHVRAEEARGAAGNREYYPDLTVSTSYNSMWDTPEHRWMVGVELNVPIQLGTRRASVEEAEASRARFESEVQRLSDSARTQVAIANKRVEEARHVLHLFDERLLPAARDQVDAARNGFVVSQNGFLAVIEAEKNLRHVELEYRTAQADLDRRIAERENALGRIAGLGDEGGAR